MLVTNRQGTGRLAPDSDYNRLVAADGRLGIGEYGEVTAFVAHSITPGVSDATTAYRIEGSYATQSVTVRGGYTDVQANFSPEMGFLRRHDYRKVAFSIYSRIRPENFLSLQEIRPHTNMWGYWGHDGFQETGYMHIDNHWEFRNAYEIHTGVNLTREGVREAFEISDGVFVDPDTYDHAEAALVGMTDQSDWINLSVRATIGGFFGGDRISLSPSLKVRSGERLTTEFSLSHNDIELPDGSFSTNLFRARVNYSFTTRIFIQILAQYNDLGEIWSANARLGWLREANTGLFIVFNQTNMIDGWPGQALNRGLTIKYTHLFDVLD